MYVNLIVVTFCAVVQGSLGIPLQQFYPYGTAAGDIALPPNDDGSSQAIPLTRPFPFFGTGHTELYVNNNGDISFDMPVSAYTPLPFPLSGNMQLIAPFWGDVFTPPGTVWYREASSNTELLQRSQKEARIFFMGLKNFRPSFLFIATWDHVGVFPGDSILSNTFQCVLVSDGIRSFVFFLYADGEIQWTQGTASSGVDAQIGFNAGDGLRFAAVPESRTPDIINIDQTTNVGRNGVWGFRVDREEITVSTCDSDTPIALNPLYGNMLGGTGVYINICEPLTSVQFVKCKFDDEEESEAKILNSNLAVCVSPLMQRSGYIPLIVMVTGRPVVSAQFLAMSPESSHAAVFLGNDALLFSNGDNLTLKWSPEDLVPRELSNNVTVDVSIQLQYRLSKKYLLQTIKMYPSATNNGELKMEFSTEFLLQCFSDTGSLPFKVCPIAFKISISSNQYLPEKISIWTGMAFVKPDNLEDTELVFQCDNWIKSVEMSGELFLFNELPPCPPTLPLAIFDVTYQKESMVSSMTSDSTYHNIFMKYFYPDVNVCYRQAIPLDEGAGQQCCYGSNGALVKGQVGGSADKESPLRSYYQHVLSDLLPYVLCCKGTSVCDTYFRARPAGSEMGYRLPVPACVYGDPHIVSLDGHKYTFNGKGEFVIIQTSTNIFALQGRMEQVLDAAENPSPGTVFTAIVARQISSNISVQFEVNSIDRSLLVLVNGDEAVFENLAVIEFQDVVLLDKGNDTVQALFSSGANVEISVLNGIISIMLVALPESMKRTTGGLMGPYNDIISDDFTPKGGGSALPLDDSLENIHTNFGKTWIISSASESLFTYRPGDSWMTYYFPDFVPMFAPTFTDTSLEDEARNVCGDDTFCLFDIAATKRVEIGAATMEGQEMLNTIMNMSRLITCSPVCENGVCLENNTCSCNDGYSGDRCTEPVLEVCSTNPCLNNGTCSKQALSFYCSCTPQFTGSLCQSKVPPFQIHLLNGSPRVRGNKVFIEFSTNKPASSKCLFDGVVIPCSTGSIIIDNVIMEGFHVFRIISLTDNKERLVVKRRVYIGSCTLQLINDGLTILENKVSIEFAGSPDVQSFTCRLDGMKTRERCRSPLRFENLSPGPHKLIILSNRCGEKRGRLSLTFDI